MNKFISNSFQVPNAFVDDVLVNLSGNACKIYLLIVRKTRGWNKQADRISYSQIQKLTGISSRTTIEKAISELVELGLITYKKGNEKSANEYRLNDDFGTTENEVASPKTVLGGSPKTVLASPKTVLASPKTVLGGSPKNGHTEIQYIKNTNYKNTREKDNAHETSQNPPKADNLAKVKAHLLELGVDNQIADDFIYFRKEIKKPLTITAINRLVTETKKTNLDLNSAIEFTLDKGWQSFTAEYYFNHVNSTLGEKNATSNNAIHPNSTTAYLERLQRESYELKRDLYPEKYA